MYACVCVHIYVHKCLHFTRIRVGITPAHRKHGARACCAVEVKTIRCVFWYLRGKPPRPVTIHSTGETVTGTGWPPFILQRIFPQQHFLSCGTLSDAQSWAGGDGFVHGVPRSPKLMSTIVSFSRLVQRYSYHNFFVCFLSDHSLVYVDATVVQTPLPPKTTTATGYWCALPTNQYIHTAVLISLRSTSHIGVGVGVCVWVRVCMCVCACVMFCQCFVNVLCKMVLILKHKQMFT